MRQIRDVKMKAKEKVCGVGGGGVWRVETSVQDRWDGGIVVEVTSSPTSSSPSYTETLKDSLRLDRGVNIVNIQPRRGCRYDTTNIPSRVKGKEREYKEFRRAALATKLNYHGHKCANLTRRMKLLTKI